jgi:4-amino-4-deoxy-L-arabinose transferase-like glycosyltransferase
MNLPASDRPPLWQRRWFGPALVALAAVAMLVWTWQTWPDVLVDFGVQLYVPWRLTQGQVLYRDIAHYTGPLSVYYNALAFWLFGASLRVLEIANLPILAATIALIYWLALRLGGRICATICGLSFVALFAFAHLTPSGNYN